MKKSDVRRDQDLRLLPKFILLALAIPLAGATGADGCNSHPSKACNAPTCASGEIQVCGRACVTPVPVSQPCSLDLCATNGTCADGATCVPTGSGNNGTCQKIAPPPDIGGSVTTVGGICALNQSANGVAFDQCANDMYCRNLSLCSARAAQTLGPSRCAVPVSEGGSCDSEVATYNAASNCSPCGPGLVCQAMSAADGRRCVRTCSIDSDCPCPSGQLGTCSNGKCTKCAEGLGKACNGYLKCCNAGDQCGPDGNNGTCCRPANSTCTRDDDCCGIASAKAVVCGLSSGATKTCQACREAGDACTDTSQCCSGGTCGNGFCRMVCTDGGSCITNKKGACRPGHYECDQFGNRSCVSNVQPATSDAVCNGIDEDCDGKVDEEVPYPLSACTDTVTCGATPFQATGWKECSNGSPSACKFKPGESYCTAASGGKCGRTIGEECDINNKCGINLVCKQPGSGGPPRCEVPFPYCPVSAPNCYPLNSPYLGMCHP